MSYSVFFDLGLKDHLVPGLQKMAGGARRVFTDLDKEIGGTQKRLNELGAHEYKLRVDSSELRDAGNEVDRLGSKMRGMSIGNIAFGNVLGNLGMRAIDGIANVGRQAIEAGADAEQQIIGLSTFVGKGRAKELYKDIQESSALTPYTTKDILPGMLQLVASGETPEKSKKDLWSLMNALSATGNAGNSFALELGESHLSQMAAQGNVDAMFMREFQRTLHIPMTKLLADEMFPNNPKKGMKQVAEWMESGELKQHVSYDLFIGALDKAAKAGGMFAGALEAQSQTIKGKWSTIKDFWNIGLSKAVLDPTTHDNIIRLEDRLISGLEGFPELIGKLSPVINQLFDDLDKLWPSVEAFGTSLIDDLKPVWDALTSSEFVSVLSDVFDGFKLIADILNPAITELTTEFKELAGIAHNAFHLKESFQKGAHEIGDMMQGKKDTITGYYWQGINDSAVLDSVRFKFITDSIGKGNFFKNTPEDWYHFVQNKSKLLNTDVYYAQSFPFQMPYMQGTKTDAKTTKGTATSDASDANDAIIKGGQKVVNINFKSFVEHMTNHFGNVKEGTAWTEREMKEMWVRVLRSAEGAIQ